MVLKGQAITPALWAIFACPSAKTKTPMNFSSWMSVGLTILLLQSFCASSTIMHQIHENEEQEMQKLRYSMDPDAKSARGHLPLQTVLRRKHAARDAIPAHTYGTRRAKYCKR